MTACLRGVLWWRWLRCYRLELLSPWRDPQWELVKPEAEAGMDWELEAEISALKQGERLMERAWLHRAG